jgi:hypothetical protein
LVHFMNPVPMLTSCVHRGSIDKLRFEPHHHEDFLFWHSVLRRLRPEQVAQIYEPLAIYFIHSDSLSGNKFKSIIWIWQCYRRLGYSFGLASVAFLMRGIIQIWLFSSERLSPGCRLKNLENYFT